MVLQRYRAKAELGKGSFGTVYLTEGRRDRKTYVVKVVDNLRENNLKVQEIRVMMHLKHRNIVEMCDFYTSNNQLCIVMDYADGGDLRREIVKARTSKVPISEEMITLWMIQVCQALDYAHEEQIIHRDIKPSNIFLMADGRSVKVGDFGISKVLDTAVGRDQMAAPEPEGRVGTKRYMAPEVLNRQEYSNKADIWSLGCVLFELTTLNHPTYEQDRRVYFEWIPAVYSRNMNELIRATMSEQAAMRPSPRELLVKLAAPMMHHGSVQHEFLQAMAWFDQQLAARYKEYEAQSNIIRQFIPTHRVKPPQQLAPADAHQQPAAARTAASSSPPHQPPAQPNVSPPPAPPPQAAPPAPTDAPRQPPPGGWADPANENFPGTGIVLSVDAQGVISVAGLLKGSTAEQSRMVDVGDVVQEVDSHVVFRRFSGLPHELLAGQMGTTVRVGLQKTPDPRRLTYIVLRRAPSPGAPSAARKEQQQQQQQAPIAKAPQPPKQSAVVAAPRPESATPPQASPEKSDGEIEHFNIPEYTDDGDMSPPPPPPAAPVVQEAPKRALSDGSASREAQMNASLQQAHEAAQHLQRQRQLAQQQLQQQQARLAEQQRLQLEQQQQQLEQRLMHDSAPAHAHHPGNYSTSSSPSKQAAPAAPSLHHAYGSNGAQQAQLYSSNGAQQAQQAQQYASNGAQQGQQYASNGAQQGQQGQYGIYGSQNRNSGSAPPMKPHGYQYGDAGAGGAQPAQQYSHMQQHAPHQHPHNLSASFEARPSAHARPAPFDPLGRSFEQGRHEQPPASPHRINTRSSYGDSYQPHQYGGYDPGFAAQQQQQQSRQMPSMRSSHDGRTDLGAHGGGYPSMRSSFDSASMRSSSAPMGGGLGGGMGGGGGQGPGTPKKSDGDTNRVLAELERVRTGIQATLAAAAASGKMAGGGAGGGGASRHPPAPIAAPPAPSGAHALGGMNGQLQPRIPSAQPASAKPEASADDGNRYNFAEL